MDVGTYRYPSGKTFDIGTLVDHLSTDRAIIIYVRDGRYNGKEGKGHAPTVVTPPQAGSDPVALLY